MRMLFLVLLSFLYFMAQSQKYSSLQVLDYAVSMTYSDFSDYGFDNGQYEIALKIPYESGEIPSIIYCWKKMKTVAQKQLQNCNLIHYQNLYRCIQLNYTTDYLDQPDTTQKITTTWTELTFSSQKGVTFIGKTSKLIYAQPQPQNLTRSVILDTAYFDKFSIYHMITATSLQALQTYEQKTTQTKLSYLHTYTFYQFYDSLISQRNYYCILYDNKVIYIFEGAVSRGGEPHYFTGILTTTIDNTSFHMWGGYSYSSGHAARDMIGYESNTQSFYDMYSLYAAAPFQDVASNINGKKNVVRVANSGPSTIKVDDHAPFHFIQFYRLFDTLDINGDEIIRDKIYNRFCYAAYFQNNQTSSNISVLSNSFKHQLIDCHIPELSIFGYNLAADCLWLLLSLFFFLH